MGKKKDVWYLNSFRSFFGFTLIELLVAVAIIGTLASLLFFVLSPVEQFKKAHDAQKKSDLEQIRTVLDTYYNDNNQYPTSLAILKPDYLPQDSKLFNSNYCYQSDNGNSFIISTNLERTSDPQAIPAPGITCSNGNYNYAITSTNTSYLAYIIPTPTIVSPTPTPTPTPVNAWTRRADFGGGGRYEAVGFSIGSKGYIGTGSNSFVYSSDFWEYDPSTNVWTQKANIGGMARYAAVGFSVGTKGYVGTGRCYDGSSYNCLTSDFWEYDPSTNVWTRKADFAGVGRWFAVGFSIGTKGYIGTGYPSVSNSSGSGAKDFWEYDPSTNVWTRKADFAGGATDAAVGFSIGTKGYIGMRNENPNDFWEYDPSTNVWTRKADFAGVGRTDAVGFSIGTKGYIGTGYGNLRDFWEYSQ